MASWMIHLRIADRLLDCLDKVSEQEFVVGNIAPDSGVPNEDWSAFTPNTALSHFKREGQKRDKGICLTDYIDRYFTKEMQKSYDSRQYSFYLGYLTHLLTDILWANNVFKPCTEKYAEEYTADKTAFVWKIKRDWYDLDYLYLQKHPDFRAFRIYQSAVGFKNTYLEMFAGDAFDNRREYITGFYLQERNDLEHEYIYLTEAEAGQFVEESVAEILKMLREYQE